MFSRGFPILLFPPAWLLGLCRLVADGHADSTVLVRATQKLTRSKTYPQATVLQLLNSTAALYDAGGGLPVNQVPGDLRELRLGEFGGSATWGCKKELASLDDLQDLLGQCAGTRPMQAHFYSNSYKQNFSAITGTFGDVLDRNGALVSLILLCSYARAGAFSFHNNHFLCA